MHKPVGSHVFVGQLHVIAETPEFGQLAVPCLPLLNKLLDR